MIDRFAHPIAFLLLPVAILPLLSMLRRRSGVGFASSSLVAALPRTLRQRAMPLKPLMLAVALALMVVALARPQQLTGRSRLSTEGIALQLVIDRSSSMNEPMVYAGQRMSRFEVVQHVLGRFVLGEGWRARVEGDRPAGDAATTPQDDPGQALQGRPHDLVGLITFARYAQTVCPLVRDHQTLVELALRSKTVDMKALDGTAIGDGVALASARLRAAEQELLARRERSGGAGSGAQDSDGMAADPATADPSQSQRGSIDGNGFTIKSKAIVLLTDGAANAGSVEPIAAAEQAAAWGIRIYAIGIGSPYAIISTPMGEQRVRIPGSMDEDTLKEMARITGGQYWLASDAQALADAYAQIDQLERTKIETLEASDAHERFGPFVAAALGVLCVQTLLACTILRRTL